jgi:HYDIN/CFA65/VesB family protein
LSPLLFAARIEAEEPKKQPYRINLPDDQMNFKKAQTRGPNRKFSMKTKIDWLHIALLAGVLAATGCGGGGGGGTSSPGLPILTMYDSSVDFGDVAVGNTTTQGVTLFNTGGSPLTLQQNSLSGAAFTTSGIGAGVTLAPGQYVTLTVSFVPSGTGKANGMVSLTSSTSTSSIDLPLSGNGVVAAHWVAFDWAASKSAVIGYNVYLRSASGESWTKLNSSPVTTTSYTDWDVQSGEACMFAVRSVSPANVEGTFSNATSATIPSP